MSERVDALRYAVIEFANRTCSFVLDFEIETFKIPEPSVSNLQVSDLIFIILKQCLKCHCITQERCVQTV